MKKVLNMTQRVLIVNKSYPAAGLEILHNKYLLSKIEDLEPNLEPDQNLEETVSPKIVSEYVTLGDMVLSAGGSPFMANLFVIDFEEERGLETKVLPYMDYDEESLPEIKRNLGDFDALIWNTKHKLNAELLDLAGPKLKAISTMSSGLDQVDLSEVKRRGLALGHALGAVDDAVADIAVGSLVAAARRFKEGVRMVENGDWKFGVQWLLGLDISGSTVGIIGFGGVGQAIARRLRGFSVARFLYSGRTDKPEAAELNASRVPLEQLLSESDYVIVACPLTAETRHLINKHTLALMKKTAVIVNIARGGIIDQDALYEALKENRIFAAALDVTTPEPIPKEHPLVKLDNCYIVPHLGTATFRTRNEMAAVTARNIVLALQGRPMECPAKL